jgi:hypothetical protein
VFQSNKYTVYDLGSTVVEKEDGYAHNLYQSLPLRRGTQRSMSKTVQCGWTCRRHWFGLWKDLQQVGNLVTTVQEVGCTCVSRRVTNSTGKCSVLKIHIEANWIDIYNAEICVSQQAVEDSRQRVKGKGKVVPVLNWAPRHEGVLGEWRYSSTHSLTSALDGTTFVVI